MTEKKKHPNPRLDGLLSAAVAVAEITGPIPLDGMSEREFTLIGKINARLIDLCREEAESWAQS